MVDDLGDLLGARTLLGTFRIHEHGHDLVHHFFVSRVGHEVQRAPREVGGDASGRDRLDPDVELLELKRHALAPAFERPFGGVVDGVEGEGDQPANRRGGDDEPVFLFPEVGEKGLRGAEHAEQVGVDLASDLLV